MIILFWRNPAGWTNDKTRSLSEPFLPELSGSLGRKWEPADLRAPPEKYVFCELSNYYKY